MNRLAGFRGGPTTEHEPRRFTHSSPCWYQALAQIGVLNIYIAIRDKRMEMVTMVNREIRGSIWDFQNIVDRVYPILERKSYIPVRIPCFLRKQPNMICCLEVDKGGRGRTRARTSCPCPGDDGPGAVTWGQ